MNFDITYQFMLPLMVAIQKATHSYGWAIILLTLLIRLLVWPLVASSTRSMKRMAALQPKLKELQTQYKDQPQVFQQKTMEFYSQNKANPLGGCLPTLVQFPILIALFAAFTGPPFQDKEIPVKVTLAKQVDVKTVSNPSSGPTVPYVSPEGKLSKFGVKPGDQTVVWGRDPVTGQQTDKPNTFNFQAVAVAGVAPSGFKPAWKISHDPSQALVDVLTGQATFPAAGNVTVEASFPESPDAPPIQVPITVEARPQAQTGWNPFGGGGESFLDRRAQSAETRTLTVKGQQVTVAVSPGSSTVIAGSKAVQFTLTPVSGDISSVRAVWHIVKDSNSATIDQDGHAFFPKPGEVTIAAVIPGEAKHEPFYFVSSLGKVARGAELLEPKNWDVLSMLLFFAVTMFLSQKLMIQPTTSMDPEQAAIQKQTQQTMPIMVTAMFFFFALPAGVYLYMVVSNIMQTLQTWLIYKTAHDDSPADSPPDGDGSKKKLDNGANISLVNAGESDPGQVIPIPKNKAKKKKK